MDLEERYALALAALERIAEYGHTDDCMSCAPVHECGCNDEDERDIARAALAALNREG